MKCDHNLIISETSERYPCFICLTCFKAEPLGLLKKNLCKCDDTSNWKFGIRNNIKYIYCDKCKKILK